MGAYQQLYFGPYLEIPKVKGKRIETFKKCDNANCKCKKRLETKFCPECGEKTTKHSIEHDCLVSPLPEFDYDFFYPPHNGGTEISKKIDWLLPNQTKGTPLEKYVINIDESHAGPIEVKDDGSEARFAFMEYAKELMQQIRDNGGEPIVRYGLFIHWS